MSDISRGISTLHNYDLQLRYAESLGCAVVCCYNTNLDNNTYLLITPDELVNVCGADALV